MLACGFQKGSFEERLTRVAALVVLLERSSTVPMPLGGFPWAKRIAWDGAEVEKLSVVVGVSMGTLLQGCVVDLFDGTDRGHQDQQQQVHLLGQTFALWISM